MNFTLVTSLLIFIQGCSMSQHPVPKFALTHPQETSKYIYGVGISSNYLQAKARALNDISTQIKLEIRSISSINKSTSSHNTHVSENITLLTSRKVNNYTILHDKLVNKSYYILIRYEK